MADATTLTPEEIQELGDPIERIYATMTNELMINIGRHITKPATTHTAAWEIQKLSELGALTKENAKIINKWIKDVPQLVRDTMDETRREALERMAVQMEKQTRAAKAPPAAEATIEAMRDYLRQMEHPTEASTAPTILDELNLVHTTMLRSSVDQYAKAVNLTVTKAQAMEQAEATQKILNQKTANVVIGKDTLQNAKRDAIKQIAREGLAGFYDKAGRKWSPEAYVNMDIRTTVHNTALTAIKDGMDEAGVDVFQVSSHAAARPLCYPYQGKFFSWGNASGEVELGNGRVVHYDPLSGTTYGEPAGLFGINCGHYPIPIVPGVTIPHGADDIQPEEVNDKQYKESQQQRAIEREIRAAKRDLEMLGDTATDTDRERVKRAQEKMRDFIGGTGRSRRYDREAVYMAKPGEVDPYKVEKPYAEKIKEMRDSIKGQPTDAQLHEAGRALVKELRNRDTSEFDKYVSDTEAEIAELTKQIDANRAEQRAARAAGDNEKARALADIESQLYNKRRDTEEALRKKQDSFERDWLTSKIAEVRPVGVKKTVLNKHIKGNDLYTKEIREIVKEVYQYYPTEWIELSVNAGPLKVLYVNRGYYSDERSELALSGNKVSFHYECAFHELGHRFEHLNKTMLQTEKEFYDRRTAGEQLVQMVGYDPGEMTRKDKFIDDYMGKYYDGSGYELVSSGFQYAFSDPKKLEQDPDYQEWIYGILLLE